MSTKPTISPKPVREIKLPTLFDHYTTSIRRDKDVVTVSTLGGITEIDQRKLLELGWIKLSDQQFQFNG